MPSLVPGSRLRGTEEVEVGFILKIQPDGAQVIGSVQDVPPAAQKTSGLG
jgi:hypothetical protein